MELFIPVAQDWQVVDPEIVVRGRFDPLHYLLT